MGILWMLVDAGIGFTGFTPCKALSGGLSGNLGSCFLPCTDPLFLHSPPPRALPYTFNTGMTHTPGTHKNTQTQVSITFHLVYRIILGRSFVDKNPPTIFFSGREKKLCT
jgi:hypothetical protein